MRVSTRMRQWRACAERGYLISWLPLEGELSPQVTEGVSSLIVIRPVFLHLSFRPRILFIVISTVASKASEVEKSHNNRAPEKDCRARFFGKRSRRTQTELFARKAYNAGAWRRGRDVSPPLDMTILEQCFKFAIPPRVSSFVFSPPHSFYCHFDRSEQSERSGEISHYFANAINEPTQLRAIFFHSCVLGSG